MKCRFRELYAPDKAPLVFEWINQQIVQDGATEPWDRRSFGEHRDTPLTHAASRGDAVLVRCLLASGADASWPKPKTGATPLHYALSKLEEAVELGIDAQQYVAVSRTLIIHGADTRKTGSNPRFSWTPEDKMTELRERGCLPDILAPYDAVVVLGGPEWQSRLDHGLRLWESPALQRPGAGAPLLVYTGLVTDRVVEHLVRRIGEGAAIGQHLARLVFDTQAHTTIQNASNVHRYLQHIPGNIYLVTLGYHMSKACEIFGVVVPNPGCLVPSISGWLPKGIQDCDALIAQYGSPEAVPYWEQLQRYPQKLNNCATHVHAAIANWEKGMPVGLGKPAPQPAAREVGTKLFSLFHSMYNSEPMPAAPAEL